MFLSHKIATIELEDYGCAIVTDSNGVENVQNCKYNSTADINSNQFWREVVKLF